MNFGYSDQFTSDTVYYLFSVHLTKLCKVHKLENMGWLQMIGPEGRGKSGRGKF